MHKDKQFFCEPHQKQLWTKAQHRAPNSSKWSTELIVFFCLLK